MSKIIEIVGFFAEVRAGAAIWYVAQQAVDEAHARQTPVWFLFNGTLCCAKVGSTTESVVQKYSADRGDIQHRG